MAWIESHQALSRHRKTLALAAELKTDRHKVIGHLHELWWWALDNADIYGDIGLTSDEVIAEASGWSLKQASAWVAALKSAGFIDETENGLSLHDWYDYAGKLNQRRDDNKERMRRKREDHMPPRDPGTNGTRAEHVQRTTSARAPATVPNLTKPNRVPNGTHTARDVAPGDDSIDEVYEHFKARVQPRSRLCPRKRIAARLTKFSVPELKEGIDRFAADPWWMEHNASQGADWFFDSDKRTEQFLLLQPRAAPSRIAEVPRAQPSGDPRPVVPPDSPFLKFREVS